MYVVALTGPREFVAWLHVRKHIPEAQRPK